jgi:UDP:flavonoid glycosyltransferase YjiC (YdhE family)
MAVGRTSGCGKARVLVIALGSTGDVNPMLGIASTLRGRGHDVHFLANPVFECFALAADLPFTPVGTEGTTSSFGTAGPGNGGGVWSGRSERVGSLSFGRSMRVLSPVPAGAEP